MFRELIDNNEKRNGSRAELNGAFVGYFQGVKERQRKTFETRFSDTPEYEDVFVFEFEIDDPELEEPIIVGKWVRKPARLTHPGENGKVTNLYKTLAALYGVSRMTDEQLNNAEEFVKEAVGREYQLTLETKPSGWIEIVHIAPLRQRKVKKDDEIPF